MEWDYKSISNYLNDFNKELNGLRITWDADQLSNVVLDLHRFEKAESSDYEKLNPFKKVAILCSLICFKVNFHSEPLGGNIKNYPEIFHEISRIPNGIKYLMVYALIKRLLWKAEITREENSIIFDNKISLSEHSLLDFLRFLHDFQLRISQDNTTNGVARAISSLAFVIEQIVYRSNPQASYLCGY